MTDSGQRIYSSDLFPSNPERGSKSAISARFVLENKCVVTAHVAGVWAEVLKIGILPKPEFANVVRIWKPKAKATG